MAPFKANRQKIKPTEAALAAAKEAEGKVEEELCFICAEPAKYWAVGVCDHRTCHVCSIRLRALFKNNECTFCKTVCPQVYMSSSSDKPFAEYKVEDVPFLDSRLSISCETKAQIDDLLGLLAFNCPVKSCSEILSGWEDLKQHVRSSHRGMLCDLCLKRQKKFSHEHRVYFGKEFTSHRDEDHIMCGFCEIWYYEREELWKHCREMHEECFLCLEKGIRHTYHLNYDKLENHFRTDHYLCPHPECMAAKFVVFSTEIDLQAHAVQEHNMDSARRILPGYDHHRGGRSEGRIAPDSNADATFVNGKSRKPGQAKGKSTEKFPQNEQVNGLMARAARRGFGGQLTSQEKTPEHDPAVLQKHQELMEMMFAIPNITETKITSFKYHVRAFQQTETSAGDLLGSVFAILDNDIAIAESIIPRLADLFDEDKNQAIRTAWIELKGSRNNFPSLPGSTIPATTPKTDRKGKGRAQNTWASAGTVSANNIGERFPALPSNSRASQVSVTSPPPTSSKQKVIGLTPKPITSRPVTNTTWGRPSTSDTSSFPSLPVSVNVSGTSSASSSRAPTPKLSKSAFPTLPVSQAEMERKARIHAVLKKPIVNPPAQTWGSAQASASSSRAPSPTADVEPIVSNGGKKKKNQKVLLMSHGMNRA